VSAQQGDASSRERVLKRRNMVVRVLQVVGLLVIAERGERSHRTKTAPQIGLRVLLDVRHTKNNGIVLLWMDGFIPLEGHGTAVTGTKRHEEVRNLYCLYDTSVQPQCPPSSSPSPSHYCYFVQQKTKSLFVWMSTGGSSSLI
jgi:hypothetical protein